MVEIFTGDLEKPYKHIKIGSWVLRYFSNKNPKNLFWHRDLETRKIWKIFGDVQIQIDNQLPQDLKRIMIEKMVYHRVISKKPFLILIKTFNKESI